jgi:hypothetical protein
MRVKRFLISLIIAISIPLVFYMTFWFANKSPFMGNWSDFSKGMFMGICIVGLPFGGLLAIDYNSRKCVCSHSKERKYSS